MRGPPIILLLLAVLGAGWLFHDTLFEAFGVGTRTASDEDFDDEDLLDADDAAQPEPERGPVLAMGAAALARQAKPALTDADAIARHALGTGPPSATVHFVGSVRAPDGSPAANVQIVAVSGGVPLRFKTNAEGAFEHTLSAGRYDLLFRGEDDTALIRRWFRVDGALSEEGVAHEFKLKETGIVVITVLRGAEPVSGMTIEATPQGELSELLKTVGTTGADGIARIESVPSGRYDFTGEIPDGPRVVHRMRVKGGGETAATIRIPNGVKFTGTVRATPDGPPISNAVMELHVRARKSTGTLIVAFTSESDGSFEVMAPRGSLADFTVLADGYAPFPDRAKRRTVLRALRNLSRNKPVKYDVKMTSGLGISGRVLDTEGAPVPGVLVQLRRVRGNQPITSVESDAQGLYAFPHLSRDVYDLGILTPGVYPAATDKLRVRVGKDAIERDLNVLMARRVFGKVVTATGEIVPAARVWVVGGGLAMRSARDAGRLLEAYSSSQGAFLLADLPMDRGLSVRASMGDLEAEPVAISANDESPAAVRLVMRATGTLKGTVVDQETNQPLRRAQIRIRPEPNDGRTGMTLQTRNDGTFTAKRLIPGKWRITPTLQGYLRHAGEIMNIPASQVQATVRMDPGLVFSGRAVTSDGKPLHNATITVRKVTNGKQSGARSVRSNRNGTFRLTGVARDADSYRLVGNRGGYIAVVRDNVRGGEQNMRLAFRKRGRR